MPSDRFGSLGACIVRMYGSHMKGVVWVSTHIYVLQVPDKCRVRAFIHVRKAMPFPEPPVVTERRAQHPWLASGVSILPRALHAGIVEHHAREPAKRVHCRVRRLLLQLPHLI